MRTFILGLINIFFLVFAISCNEEPKKTSQIKIGDSSTIVTERDEKYLQNFTEDISPTNKRSSEKQITGMMREVDSAKSAQLLENENANNELKGFAVSFDECKVILNGINAHSLKPTDYTKQNSVSFIKDEGDIYEMHIGLEGLDEAKIEQRYTTKLMVVDGTDQYVLNDLGKSMSPWFTLASKENHFISLTSKNLQFSSFNNTKLKNALDRELRKNKKPRQEIQQWMNRIQKTNSPSDAPCKLIVVSAQWRITGKKEGKRIQKLIQLDIP